MEKLDTPIDTWSDKELTPAILGKFADRLAALDGVEL